jgi:peptidylprolyl isomerase
MKLLSALGILLFLFIGCSNENEVIETDSGLQFMNDTVGTGPEAKVGDLVAIHFQGWIVSADSNGTGLFEDWSNDTTKMMHSLGQSRPNTPIKFKLGDGVFIKGSDEGIVGMKAGGTRTIIIPSNLAYGEQGMGPVPPNSDLKIVIELVEVKEGVEAKQWDVDTTGANVTASGLRYKIIEEGTGVSPDSGDVVSVHYSGWLRDGTKFDSSVERDEPITFTLGQGMVIPGWEEGIKLLKKGAKAKLIIPASLAYGERMMGQIPPNSTLIFDVELVDVVSQ